MCIPYISGKGNCHKVHGRTLDKKKQIETNDAFASEKICRRYVSYDEITLVRCFRP